MGYAFAASFHAAEIRPSTPPSFGLPRRRAPALQRRRAPAPHAAELLKLARGTRGRGGRGAGRGHTAAAAHAATAAATTFGARGRRRVLLPPPRLAASTATGARCGRRHQVSRPLPPGLAAVSRGLPRHRGSRWPPVGLAAPPPGRAAPPPGLAPAASGARAIRRSSSTGRDGRGRRQPDGGTHVEVWGWWERV